ncbi:MAG: SPOR domain-containing protein [Alphaproteobacteria bacterium HGW-Alphaproteobacteria-14]|nr:MAG: SPOR domain-containing protein [Alphaproteobacteria bacterium HGW-Alphaproteobacteria-14]
MIDAEYEELDEAGGELDLADTDSLPWLESDEEDDGAGGLDTAQILGFAAVLVLLLGAVVGGVWFFTNKAAGGDLVADGSVIEAPAGPIKERPENPGGKTFAGTGNVAPVVGEGGTRPAVVATTAPATAAPKPSISTASSTDTVPVSAPAATTGVGVQLAAYGTRARAEQGWSDLSRRTDKLAGVKYRVIEGKVDIGTVYRLQAVAPDRAAAEKLCAELKSDGLDCQIK